MLMAVILINRHNTKKILPFNFLLELERYFTCKNIVCRASLKWRMQLSRYLKNWPYEKPTKEYSIQNGQYTCGKYSKKIKHQSNIKRYLQICKNKVKKSLYKCALCPRTERFKCRLENHMKQHASQASKTCPNCHASFKRIDHFQNHEIVCNDNNEGNVNDEQFIVSFAFPDNSVIEFPETASTGSLSTPSSPPLEVENVTIDDTELEDVSDLGNDQVVPEHPDTLFSPLKATPNPDKNSVMDWHTLKETQQKIKNLENIILSSINAFFHSKTKCN